MALVRIGTIWDRQGTWAGASNTPLGIITVPYLLCTSTRTTTPARNPGCGMELKSHLNQIAACRLQLEAEGMHHAARDPHQRLILYPRLPSPY